MKMFKSTVLFLWVALPFAAVMAQPGLEEQQLLEELDTDDSGGLTEEEFSRLFEEDDENKVSEGAVALLFATFDVDRSGELEAGELSPFSTPQEQHEPQLESQQTEI